jgi:hypothetical protein
VGDHRVNRFGSKRKFKSARSWHHGWRQVGSRTCRWPIREGVMHLQKTKLYLCLKITPQMSILDSRIIFHAFVTFFKQSTPENLLVYQWLFRHVLGRYHFCWHQDHHVFSVGFFSVSNRIPKSERSMRRHSTLLDTYDRLTSSHPIWWNTYSTADCIA